ncbi:MAG: polymerase IV protein [Parcubacteria group bacterium GW2011_GWA2_48_9]|nr:MAG: polymerase IV protein [Parcubacteria group bacterium GW2011_GWA2_48_9]
MPAKRIIMHLDMNSYFASVEQQANPTLRGKPLGVVATMTPHGCILASSKEAKAVGIKTGCRADEAKFLYPDIILVEVDPSKYRSTTEKIFSIIRQYSDVRTP